MSPHSRKTRILASMITFMLLVLLSILLVNHSGQSRKNQKALLDKQQSEFAKTATADPILKYLPYGSLDYNITPTFESISGKRTLVLSISVILTDADYKQSPQDLQTTIDQKEQASLSYIRSIGFDPSKYTIQYGVPAH